jgi:hypothetical protein
MRIRIHMLVQHSRKVLHNRMLVLQHIRKRELRSRKRVLNRSHSSSCNQTACLAGHHASCRSRYRYRIRRKRVRNRMQVLHNHKLALRHIRRRVLRNRMQVLQHSRKPELRSHMLVLQHSRKPELRNHMLVLQHSRKPELRSHMLARCHNKTWHSHIPSCRAYDPKGQNQSSGCSSCQELGLLLK